MANAALPSPNVPLVDDRKMIVPDWYQGFIAILRRSGLVSSVFGRTGDVVAAVNDYSFSQISGLLAASQTPAFTGDVTKSAGSGVTVLASIPAISGANLTALNASNLGSGTVPSARLNYGSSAGTVAQGNDSRFPAAASSTWTPTDASGAGLSLTLIHNRYVQIGPLVYVTCALNFPITADGSNAKLGGLPVATLNESNVGGTFLITYGSTPGLAGLLIANATTISIFDQAGAAVTNVTLSSQTIRFQFFYPVA